MKVLLVTPSFYPATVYGGPIFSTLHTSQELAKLDDMEIYVSTTNANMTSRLDVKMGKWQQFEKDFYVKYYNETKINLISINLLFNIWREIKSADLIHAQYMFSTPTPIALFYSKVFNKPIVLSPRGALCKWCLNQGSKYKKSWLKIFIKPYIHKIIWHATAEQEKNEILEQFPNAKIQVIPNGIAYNEFQIFNQLDRKAFIKKFAKKDLQCNQIVVSMGRLQKKKGFDILIEAIIKVKNNFPNVKLLIAGSDETEGVNLLKQIEQLKLNDTVFLVGEIYNQDKIDFLANADVFALPSHNENFGNVYIESLASGTPIVASKATPWEEVEKANCGKWVNNTIDETADAIIEVLKCNRNIMRKNSKMFAKKYDWSNIALEFKKLYTGINNDKNKS
jgi:glycosyltransferase involved in cell wall biosynthesis